MIRLIALAVPLAANMFAQLPDGAGRAELEKVCKGCHELGKSVSVRQDRMGWQGTLSKMQAMGTKGTEQEFHAVLEYLAKNFAADEIPPINLNTAPAVELESRLSLRRSQAAALIAWRSQHGKFQSIDDVKKVPGIDIEKIEAKKERIVF
jgi:competence protein ComEA